jgi:hypothetical protein
MKSLEGYVFLPTLQLEFRLYILEIHHPIQRLCKAFGFQHHKILLEYSSVVSPIVIHIMDL